MTKVLIVEDNDMLNQAYSVMLQYNGYDTMSAYDGQQGLEMAEKFNPNIILLDYLMPIIDGREFLIQYKPKEKPEVKILLLTNLEQQEKIKEVLSLGVYRHLLKAETDPSQLTAILEELSKK